MYFPISITRQHPHPASAIRKFYLKYRPPALGGNHPEFSSVFPADSFNDHRTDTVAACLAGLERNKHLTQIFR